MDEDIQIPVADNSSESVPVINSEEARDMTAPAEAAETEEDSTMAFPMARVVRILRQEMQSGKQIRGEVKSAINDWLGNLLRKVAKEMDKTPYGSIGIADFQRATQPYDMIEHLVKEKERLIVSIDKLKHDAEQIKRDLTLFYIKVTGEQQEL